MSVFPINLSVAARCAGADAAPRDTLSYNASKDYRLRLVSLSNEVVENSKNISFRIAARECRLPLGEKSRPQKIL